MAQQEGSLPPVRLPLVSDSGTPADSQSVPAAAASGSGAASPFLDEDDLFGSGSENLEAAPSAPGAGLGAASAGGGLADPQHEDDASEKDLFGDDLDERDLFGSDEGDDAGGVAPRRPQLGSAEPPGASAIRAAPPTPRAVPATPSEVSSMDEREIFGDVSDDEPEKVEDVVLRRRPAPMADRTFKALRLPNILNVEKRAFSAKTCTQQMMDGYRAGLNTQNKEVVRLLNPENCVRWRFKKGPDGQILTDDDGRPQYESNARLVEWEDGSRTMYVGSEVFNVSEIDEKILLFEENTPDVSVCHGFVNKRLIATPRNLTTASHDALKRAQFQKFEPTRRSLLTSLEDRTQQQEVNELQAEQKKVLDKPRRSVGGHADGPGITGAFLEDDAPTGDGPSVLEMKQAAKRQKT